MNDYLFLYGTLLPDLVPAELKPVVQKLRYVGDGTVPGRLYDLGNFPGLVLDATAQTRVSGGVFALPDVDVFESLDAYEEYTPAQPEASLYVRVRFSVALSDGRTVSAWLYVYNRDPGDRPWVQSGDWKARHRAGETL